MAYLAFFYLDVGIKGSLPAGFAAVLAILAAKVNLDEMEFDDTEGGSFSHECRCGEAYVVTSAELREGFEVLDCAGCSLFIKVLGKPVDSTEAAVAIER